MNLITLPGEKSVVKKGLEESAELVAKEAAEQIAKQEGLQKLFTTLKTRLVALIAEPPREQLWKVMEDVEGVLRPRVDDVELQRKFINEIYRNNAAIGYGSTADAIRFTKKTGELVGGSDHVIKGQYVINGLKNWLQRFPETTEHDRRIINLIITDIEDALK